MARYPVFFGYRVPVAARVIRTLLAQLPLLVVLLSLFTAKDLPATVPGARTIAILPSTQHSENPSAEMMARLNFELLGPPTQRIEEFFMTWQGFYDRDWLKR